MAKNFFVRLREYYVQVAKVLKGEADAASIFANTTDIGVSRENVYAEFLKQHAPSKCNVFLGGFLFDEDGNESKQLDIIITTDSAPRFDLFSKNAGGKSFSPVEGTLGVVSVKSTLNNSELVDALQGIASIPATRPLVGRVNTLFSIKNYDNWPLKVIYASNGISPDALLKHVKNFYAENPDIPINRRPDFIHVIGSCLIVRGQMGMNITDKETGAKELPKSGEYYLFTDDADLQAIVWTLNQIQQNASASTHIHYSYGELINKVHGLSLD